MIQQLTAESDELRSTVETLKAEFISSNDEAERVTRELEALRTRALHDNAQESMLRERELRETQSELERCRMERDEWERALMQERVVLNEASVSIDGLSRDLEIEQEARRRDVGALEVERERANNLQSVLEDFQAGGLFSLQAILLSLMHTQRRTMRSARRSQTSKLGITM